MINDSNDESEQHLLWCAYTNFRLIHTLVFNYLGTLYQLNIKLRIQMYDVICLLFIFNTSL